MKVKAIVKAGTAVAKSDWQKAATCHKVTLKYEGRSMTVDFWCGSLNPVPTAFDVMYCLTSDTTYTDYSFEEWAESLGYDADSREAEKTYKACITQTKRFKKFMLDSFDDVVYLDEDELEAWIEE